jgi:hypothetical protein
MPMGYFLAQADLFDIPILIICCMALFCWVVGSLLDGPPRPPGAETERDRDDREFKEWVEEVNRRSEQELRWQEEEARIARDSHER